MNTFLSQPRKITFWHWLGFFALAGLLILYGLAGKFEPVDDAFISFRYAKNWANGFGPVFNVGERVEGYTNFLWMALMALAGKMGLDIVQVGKWLGMAFACLALPLTFVLGRLIARERNWSPGLAWVPLVILVAYPGWAYWGFSGMETPMLLCLVLGFILLGCRLNASKTALFFAALLGVLAAMTRWEIVILWPVVVITQLFDRNRPAVFRWLRAVVLALLLLIGFGVYYTARYSYYGDLLPNTFYAKMGGTFISRLTTAGIYTGEFALNWLLPLTLIGWLLGEKKRWSILLTIIFAIYLAYVVWAGGDHFPWLRFYLPILPIAAVFIADTINRLLVLSPRFTHRNKLAVAFTLAFALMVFGIAWRMELLTVRMRQQRESDWKTVARWVRQTFPPDYQIVLAVIGTVPYYCENPVIDFLGLTDYEIAHLGRTDSSEPPGHQRYNINAVLQRRPEIFLGMARLYDFSPTQRETAPGRKAFQKMLDLPLFQQNYRFEVGRINGQFVPYWIRNDLVLSQP